MCSKSTWAAAILCILLTYALFSNTNQPPLVYSRQAFGNWIDGDRDCQNLRAELLIEQSLSPVTFRDKRNCVVHSGQWKSKYTNKMYYLASDLEVDHIIPLKYAWENGADRWSDSQRIAFYNDPLNLAIVEREVNREKGALSIENWLPKENVDWYKDRWYKVHSKYDLEEK